MVAPPRPAPKVLHAALSGSLYGLAAGLLYAVFIALYVGALSGVLANLVDRSLGFSFYDLRGMAIIGAVVLMFTLPIGVIGGALTTALLWSFFRWQHARIENADLAAAVMSAILYLLVLVPLISILSSGLRDSGSPFQWGIEFWFPVYVVPAFTYVGAGTLWTTRNFDRYFPEET